MNQFLMQLIVLHLPTQKWVCAHLVVFVLFIEYTFAGWSSFFEGSNDVYTKSHNSGHTLVVFD
jgi:hypothetical protein